MGLLRYWSDRRMDGRPVWRRGATEGHPPRAPWRHSGCVLSSAFRRNGILSAMGSRLLAAAVVLGTILSAVLLGVMLAAPLISQPAALAPVASETPAPSEAPAEGLPPLGLYLLRGPYAFGPCLGVELTPLSYPIAANAVVGEGTVLWWQRGVSGCDSRTGDVEEVPATVTRVARDDAPDETVGYTVGFHLPPSAGVATSIELTILSERSTQDLLQVVDSGGGGGQGLVFDLVEAIDPILDPLPSATPVAALRPIGLYLLQGPLLSADGPCIVLELDEPAYPADSTVPGAATVRWWERGGDPEDPAACLTRRSDVSEVPASVVTAVGPTGAVETYGVAFLVPLTPGAEPDDVEIDIDLRISAEDVLRGNVMRPSGPTAVGFDRVDSIDPPPAP